MGFKKYCGEQKDNTAETGKRVESLYNTYKGKSEDELLAELVKHVATQKQNGTYDYQALEKMIDKVTPYLTNEQRQKLSQVLEQIK
ncbi:MAG: hypothetical protein IJ318_01775 [Clostridia bacterium]|nr:hypothetical protein [Clostridia bacterium]